MRAAGPGERDGTGDRWPVALCAWRMLPLNPFTFRSLPVPGAASLPARIGSFTGSVALSAVLCQGRHQFPSRSGTFARSRPASVTERSSDLRLIRLNWDLSLSYDFRLRVQESFAKLTDGFWAKARSQSRCAMPFRARIGNLKSRIDEEMRGSHIE